MHRSVGVNLSPSVAILKISVLIMKRCLHSQTGRPDRVAGRLLGNVFIVCIFSEVEFGVLRMCAWQNHIAVELHYEYECFVRNCN